MVYSAELYRVVSVRYNESRMYYSCHQNVYTFYIDFSEKKILEKSKITNLHLGDISYSIVPYSCIVGKMIVIGQKQKISTVLNISKTFISQAGLVTLMFY